MEAAKVSDRLRVLAMMLVMLLMGLCSLVLLLLLFLAVIAFLVGPYGEDAANNDDRIEEGRA